MTHTPSQLSSGSAAQHSVNSRSSETNRATDKKSNVENVAGNVGSMLPAGYFLPMDPAARSISFGGKLKVTYGLTWVFAALMVATFVVADMKVVSFSDNFMIGPSTEVLVGMGALTFEHAILKLQLYRILWSAYLHAGIIHLVSNASSWLMLGAITEPDWGAWEVFAIFNLAAVAGNLASLAYMTRTQVEDASLGASGGICGLLTALPIYVLQFYDTIPKAKLLLVLILCTIALTIASSFAPHTDYHAHFGGALAGPFIAILFLPSPPKRHLLPTVSPTASLAVSPSASPSISPSASPSITNTGIRPRSAAATRAVSAPLTQRHAREAFRPGSAGANAGGRARQIRVLKQGVRGRVTDIRATTHFEAFADGTAFPIVVNPAASRISFRKTLDQTDQLGGPLYPRQWSFSGRRAKRKEVCLLFLRLWAAGSLLFIFGFHIQEIIIYRHQLLQK